MKIIIAIDDTDNLESRGTGFRARTLGTSLMEAGIIELHNISRHQLLVHPDIPYTSHNSSASLVCECLKEIKDVIDFGTEFLLRESADGSDTGFCIAEWNKISEEVVDWGNRAKKEVLSKAKAHELADKENIFLIGLTGKKIGVIGSLAAVGLRKGGEDGRILWLEKLRETNAIFTSYEIYKNFKIENITTKDGQAIPNDEKIRIDDWCRPVNKNKKVTLIVEEAEKNESYKWQNASKEYIKSISQ